MDANGTKFHLLLGEEDWGACRLDSLEGPRLRDAWKPQGALDPDITWDDKRSELRLASRAWLFPQPGSGQPPQRRDRRGAARDRYGNWYWIAGNTNEIMVRPSGSNVAGRFWSASVDRCDPPRNQGAFAASTVERPPRALTLRALTITVDHFLIAGTLNPGGLLVFDLHGGGPPVHHVWSLQWSPFDFSPRQGGGLWVLEWPDLAAAVPTWIWELDRDLQVVPSASISQLGEKPDAGEFTPGSAPDAYPVGDRPITRADARQHRGQYPVAIEGLRDGSVLVVDSPPSDRFSTVWRYAAESVSSAPLVTQDDTHRVIREQDRASFTLLGADAAVVPSDVNALSQSAGLGHLYVVAATGNQAFEFTLSSMDGSLSLRLTDRYLPMRLFGGKALVSTSDPLPSYDYGDRWLSLVEQRRPLFAESGTIVSPYGTELSAGIRSLPAFDGGTPDCVWHRLMLDACIPPGTSITVESQAVNDLQDADERDWSTEPGPYLRRTGSEIPFQRQRSDAGDGTWELLFQQAKGRYLLLRLTLRGTGTSTPRLRALRAWYPRFSWLEQYLPDVYRDDAGSAHFLDRFLGNLEGIATGIEDRIASVQSLFDPRSAPSETLEWLAGWFGLVLDPTWDEARRRLLIDHVMEFFQWRGTLHGMQMGLHLALDPCAGPEIFAPPGASDLPRRPPPFQITETFLRRHRVAAIDEAPPDALPLDDNEGSEPRAQERWQAFLKRRYHRIESVNSAHALLGARAWASFETIQLPRIVSHPQLGELPPFLGRARPNQLLHSGVLIRDWNDFKALVLDAGRLAHRFSVLLPARGESVAEQQARAALVRRVIELEKPAHTIFDVSFSWSAFRVGQARLGSDTFLESDAHRAFAIQPLVLNRAGLAQSYLASARTRARIDGRHIIGEGNLSTDRHRQGGCLS